MTRLGIDTFTPDRQAVAERIEAVGIFGSLTSVQQAELAQRFDGVRLQAGTVLLAEGAVPEALYIVQSGRLRVTVGSPDGERTTGWVGRGEVVGEMALLGESKRSATVTASRDSELFRLPREAFDLAIASNPELVRSFARLLVNRARASLNRPSVAPRAATIAIVAPHRADVADFARRFAAAAGNSTAVIGAADAVDRSNVAAWLLEVEQRFELTILVTDPSPSAWTMQCLRHADQAVLYVDSPEAPECPVLDDPACAALLSELSVSLVVEHGASRSAPATHDLWAFQRFFNLTPGDRSDVAMVARHLCGRPVVCVLSGGGARGFAQFGVLKALADHGLPVDGVVGTSAGSLVGALSLLPRPIDETVTLLINWFEQVKWRRDMNPPIQALTSGRSVTQGLRGFFGELQIEDMPAPYAAVSCDLVSATPVVHTRGPVWQAVRASIAVPGLFPPVGTDGKVLVDGGVLANLPVGIARRLHPHALLVAIDVGNASPFTTKGSVADGIYNGWQRRSDKSGVTMARILARLTELGRDDSGGAIADVYVRPDIERFAFGEVSAAHAIVDAGCSVGTEAISEIEQALASAAPNS